MRAITPEVRDVLDRCRVDERSVRLPPGQLDRKLYLAVDKVLKGAGGRWNRKAGAHLFDRDPRPTLGLALQEGRVVDVQKELQAYYTPPPLARLVVRAAGVGPGRTVLEPSAGGGALVDAVLEATDEAYVLAVELDDHAATGLEERYRSSPQVKVERGDFLQLDPVPHDCVAMNPPFANGADLAHVAHASRFLAPGGRLAAVIPSGAVDRRTRAAREFWDDLADVGEYSVLDVPDGTFRGSGTMVRTRLLMLKRPR